MFNKLFPTDLPERQWLEFSADGFSGPVAGLIHRASHPIPCGLPLGGIDTGCLDLEPNGTFGRVSIFNSLTPRRGPMNLPFLGLSVGPETWILSTQKLQAEIGGPPREVRKVKPMADIQYWGHYPVADLQFESDCPLALRLRTWSPFIPGDVAASNTPVAVFELQLSNDSADPKSGMIVFSFPGPLPQEISGPPLFNHQAVQGTFSGVLVSHESNVGYALGVIGEDKIRTGGDLGVDGGAWSRIGDAHWFAPATARELPAENGQPGASIGVEYELKPGEEKVIRFLLTWYAPEWKAGGRPTDKTNTFTHMYAARYSSALDAARFLADHHESLLRRILAWQAVIYSEKDLPVWLRETLVNILHLITEDSVWAQAKSPIPEWCKTEDGLFALNECPRGCPQMECIPCSFYGNFPLVFFFPELALSTLRAYKGYQFPDGQMPWVFGGCTANYTPPYDLAIPSRGYGEKAQTSLDGTCYADMVFRYWNRTGDKKFLEEFYPSLKKNTIFTMTLRPEAGPASVVSAPSGNKYTDWFELVDLYGIIPHLGGVHLAHLGMAEKMAREMGDDDFARQCREWFDQGSEIMERETWNSDHYLLYSEPETGKKSDVIMGFQLDGEWIARIHNLPPVFLPDRVRTTLDTLRRTNITERGVIVFQAKDDPNFNPGYWTADGFHIPGTLMDAMLYIYYGQAEFGLDLARRAMHTLVVENGLSWDQPILFSSGSGKMLYGNDYYQNLILWTLPAALANSDLTTFCGPGNLVDRILSAAKPERKQ